MNFYAKKIIYYAAVPVLLSLHFQTASVAMEKYNGNGTILETPQKAKLFDIKRDVRPAVLETSGYSYRPKGIFEALNPDEEKERDEFARRAAGNAALERAIRQQDKEEAAATAKAREAFQALPWYTKVGVGAKDFFATLFQPFVEDAPKVLEVAKKEGQKIEEQGFGTYAWNVGGQVAKTAIEHPVDAMMLPLGLMYGGVDLRECSPAVPFVMGVLGGVKNGKLLYSLASSIDSKTFLDTSLKLALIGGAVWAVSEVPMASALPTVTLGDPSQVNVDGITTEAPPSIVCTEDGVCGSTWLANSNNVAFRSFNVTTQGTIYGFSDQVTLGTASSSVLPQIGVFPSGLFGVVYQNGLDIMLNVVNAAGVSNSGGSVQVNTNTAYTSIVSADITGLTGGKGVVTWSGSSAESYNDIFRIATDTGTFDTSETIFQTSATLLTASSLTSLSDDTALAVFGNSTGSYGITISSSGTLGSAFKTLTTPSSNPLVAGSGLNALVVAPHIYGSGSTNSILGHIIDNGVATGNDFNVTNFDSELGGVAVASAPNGYLAAWSQLNTTTLNSDIYGTFISPTGVVQTYQFVVPNDLSGGASTVGSFQDGNVIMCTDQNNDLLVRSVFLNTTTTSSPTPTPTPSPTPSASPSFSSASTLTPLTSWFPTSLTSSSGTTGSSLSSSITSDELGVNPYLPTTFVSIAGGLWQTITS